MSSLLERVREEAMHLSEEERGILAHELLTSLDPDDPGADKAWEEEIARRVERIRSGTEQGHPAEEVFAEIRKKFGAR
jgi:putative addiction module component (TIGR02574 family)